MCFYISGQSGNGEEEGAAVSLHVEVVLNPLSKAAQRVAPILEWLRSSFHASIKVAPKPKQKLKKPMPEISQPSYTKCPNAHTCVLLNKLVMCVCDSLLALYNVLYAVGYQVLLYRAAPFVSCSAMQCQVRPWTDCQCITVLPFCE